MYGRTFGAVDVPDQRAVRQSTGAIGAATTTTVTVELGEAFESTSYTAVVTVEDSTGDLRVLGISSRTTSQVVVRVQNVNALVARTGTLHVLAVA